MGNCDDIGKQPLDDLDECKEAASSLGLNYQPVSRISITAPKGCYKYKQNVYWNYYEHGSSRIGYVAICKADGKYVTRSCI